MISLRRWMILKPVIIFIIFLSIATIIGPYFIINKHVSWNKTFIRNHILTLMNIEKSKILNSLTGLNGIFDNFDDYLSNLEYDFTSIEYSKQSLLKCNSDCPSLESSFNKYNNNINLTEYNNKIYIHIRAHILLKNKGTYIGDFIYNISKDNILKNIHDDIFLETKSRDKLKKSNDLFIIYNIFMNDYIYFKETLMSIDGTHNINVVYKHKTDHYRSDIGYIIIYSLLFWVIFLILYVGIVLYDTYVNLLFPIMIISNNVKKCKIINNKLNDGCGFIYNNDVLKIKELNSLKHNVNTYIYAIIKLLDEKNEKIKDLDFLKTQLIESQKNSIENNKVNSKLFQLYINERNE